MMDIWRDKLRERIATGIVEFGLGIRRKSWINEI